MIKHAPFLERTFLLMECQYFTNPFHTEIACSFCMGESLIKRSLRLREDIFPLASTDFVFGPL